MKEKAIMVARGKGLRLGSLLRRLPQDRGSIVYLFAAVLPVILGIAALVVDVGHAAVSRRQMQNAADAASLAAASLLPSSSAQVLQQATDMAIGIAAANGASISAGDVYFSTVSAANDQVTVHTAVDVHFSFAPAIGVAIGAVSTQGASQIGSMAGGLGVEPWGVVLPDGGFVFGDTYCLKLGSNGGGGACTGARQGNFQPLDIDNDGNSSGNTYKDLIHYGSQTLVTVGQTKNINTGNMVGPTQQGTGCTGNNGLLSGNTQQFDDVIEETATGYRVLEWTSPRLVIIPIVHYPDSATAVVDGFTVFFVSGCGSNGAVLGKFVDVVVPNGIWGNYTGDFGARVVKLVS
jgi:Flp pilus assembly protein TadG